MLGRDVVILTLDQARVLAVYFEGLQRITVWNWNNFEVAQIAASLRDDVARADAVDSERAADPDGPALAPTSE